jgi:hypothetical protein
MGKERFRVRTLPYLGSAPSALSVVKKVSYRFAMMRVPNSEQETSVAPSVRRAKS